MIIVIQCTDQVGRVAAISGVLSQEKLNIVSLREHVDIDQNHFYMRVQVEQDAPAAPLTEKLRAVLPADAIVQVNPRPEKKGSGDGNKRIPLPGRYSRSSSL
ncbi:ACT domain-containing protein [Chitinophaga sedimenti]|uniref:ACT domain-containing protein n=1 Tax=Chitinophaga sedimenti TaxID=2033606 RepID=UPI002002B769|nr:ACT domain-containing protein [Chitinophaga sedimenti]MCK7559064.1 ACT domain-containing protein [Chitinophaga sedimenti]